ncbi:zinc ribbon domain-containing protein [Streptomyces sp. NPDC059153]|uniref:zinc ribbon domain-containing protein n=1 Tax=Streptomyces sp. NPDC059153 TaxID=3346743 RepID=UPI0036B2353B
MTPSKTCSACGWQNPRLPLADRTFHCDECGLRIDRDTNAARNIAAHAAVSGTQPAKRSPPVARRPKTPAEHPSDFPAPGVGSRTRRNGKTPGPPVRRHLGGAIHRRPPSHAKDRQSCSEGATKGPLREIESGLLSSTDNATSV